MSYLLTIYSHKKLYKNAKVTNIVYYVKLG